MRKGQFFMIGLLLLAAVIFGVVGLRGSAFVTGDTSTQVRNYFKKGIDEFPVAVENGLKTSYTVPSVRNSADSYLDFLRYTNTQRGLSARYYFVTGIFKNGNLNVVVGNYWREDREINLTLSGTSRNELVPAGETSVLSFSSQKNIESLQVEFGSYEDSFKVYSRPFSLIRGFSDRRDGVWNYRKISN